MSTQMEDIGYGVHLLSPHDAHGLVIDGRLIPRMHVATTGDRCTLVLDGRFACDGTPDEVARWARMVAQALAVGAGYPHLGADAPVRPFSPEIKTIAPPLRVVE